MVSLKKDSDPKHELLLTTLKPETNWIETRQEIPSYGISAIRGRPIVSKICCLQCIVQVILPSSLINIHVLIRTTSVVL